VLGDRLQVVARLGDGAEVLRRQPRAAGDRDLASLQPGEPVGVTFAPQAGLLLGAEDEVRFTREQAGAEDLALTGRPAGERAAG
jgi:hypothetical protein